MASFRPPSSRLRLPLERLYVFPRFPPFAGTRSRLRGSILLAVGLLCAALFFPLARRTSIFRATEEQKIHLTLKGEVADFQREFLREYDALGK